MNTIKNIFFTDSLLMTKNATIIEIKTYKRLEAIPKIIPLITDETIIQIKKAKSGQKYLLESNKYCLFKKNKITTVIESTIRAMFGKKYNLNKETEPSKGNNPTKQTKNT